MILLYSAQVTELLSRVVQHYIASGGGESFLLPEENG